jgi:hypothetical protein
MVGTANLVTQADLADPADLVTQAEAHPAHPGAVPAEAVSAAA